MRLAGHQDLVVLKQDVFREGNDRLVLSFPEIEEPFGRGIRRLRGDRAARVAQHLAFENPFCPSVPGHIRERLEEKFHDRRIGFLRCRHGNDGRVFGNVHGPSSPPYLEHK
jgi:hypothetical protein